MKKFVAFLVLGIILVSCDGCDPINPPKPPIVKVKQFTIVAKSDLNGIISPSKLVVDSGSNATFNILPNDGFIVNVFKVNGTVVPLTSSQYILSNVSSDSTKLEVTFKKRVKYTVTASISYIGFFNSGAGGGTIFTTVYNSLGDHLSATQVVDSGSNVIFVVLPYDMSYNGSIPSTFQVTPMSGLKIEEFNVDGTVITSTPHEFNNVNVDGINKSVTYQTYTIPNITSDKKVEIKLKAIAGLSSEFYGVRWVCDSTYITDLKDVVWVYYDLPSQHSLTFLEDGMYYQHWKSVTFSKYDIGCYKWSIDKKTNPWILMMEGGVEKNIEILNDKKLVVSYSTSTSGDAKFIREVYIPLQ